MITTILLDDGGVLSDNQRRGEQWRYWLGLFLSERLGGTAEAWGEANRAIIPTLFDPVFNQQWADATINYADFERWYAQAWFEQMCQHMNFALPAHLDVVKLYQEASMFVTSRVDAAFPQVPETVLALAQRGYRLYTASNESSADLHGYLSAMKVRDCFERLYGPDLVDSLKNSPLYYQRISADAQIEPSTALVVDDNPQCIAWAQQAGFQALLCGKHASAGIATLSELMGWLEGIGHNF